MVVKDVIVVAGVPSPATDILNERQRAPKEMPPDDVRGYDVRTGKLLWTFHVVPRKGEFGNDTWLNDSWTYSGNSGAWSLLSADEDLGYVYLPFEEATGDYYGGTRPGNNLFAESLVCLDAGTAAASGTSRPFTTGCGTTTFPAPRCLETSRSTAAASRRWRRCQSRRSSTSSTARPVSLSGRSSSALSRRATCLESGSPPHQPIPFQAARIRSAGRERQRPHRLHSGAEGRGQENASANTRPGPIYTPPVLMGSPDGPKGLLLVPGTNGGADWGGAAFDTETGILYVPSAHMPTVIALGKSTNAESTLPYVKQTSQWPSGPQGLPDPFKPPYSRLVAIDLNKGDILWSVANGDGLAQSSSVQGPEPAADRRSGPPRGARDQELRLHG